MPGTHGIFLPAKIAVAPVTGDLATGTHEAGGVFDASGYRQKVLEVSDPAAVVHAALMTGLADAGLNPVSMDSSTFDSQTGVDLLLTCELQQLNVEKHFGVDQTIHGQYFTMTSKVRLKYQLKRRGGAIVYDREVNGIEDEPPKPVGGEVFFPLETDPAESLSVALSRAIGAPLADPQFRTAFPAK